MSVTRLTSFLRMSGADRGLFLEALAVLYLARVVVLVCPTRHWPGLFGLQVERDSHPVQASLRDAQRQVVEGVALAVRRTRRACLWREKCLPEAIAASLMLRRRGVASCLYLGVTRGSDQRLKAHAWLASGGEDVIGGREAAGFSVVGQWSSGSA
jgi:hypothetical protein